jgi:hypothetical protein
MDTYHKLKLELSLSKKEVDGFKKQFISYPHASLPIFFGSNTDKKPQVVIGGPCIRYDLTAISLNSLYQIAVPIYVASKFKTDCYIFLGVQEEIILSPKKYLEYKKLAEEIKKLIQILAQKYQVKVKIIDSSLSKYDDIIEKTVKDLKIKLSQEDSTYLFAITRKRSKKKMHSNIRCIVSERVTACHTQRLLKRITEKSNFMIGEDIEQYPCYKYSTKFNDQNPGFLSFLPAPAPDGKSTLLKAKNQPKMTISPSGDFLLNIPDNIESWVKEIYQLIEKIINNKL